MPPQEVVPWQRFHRLANRLGYIEDLVAQSTLLSAMLELKRKELVMDKSLGNEICLPCQENDRNKPSWGSGPWNQEPNRVEFEHSGLPCLLHRNIVGSWCGYVAAPPGHPTFEKDYNDVAVSVHGGLTYAEHCNGHVCHTPKEGEPDNVWWLGFDCAHARDLIPDLSRRQHLKIDEHYWTLEEVKEETKQLAEQLAAMIS